VDAYTTSVAAPVDAPYLTCVGGTFLSTTGPGGAWLSESAWNRGNGVGSGGGVSLTYALPLWQQGVGMDANGGSIYRRNFPDVAMVADYIWAIYDNGNSGSYGGTSCSAPLWAGIMALVNQQAAANGQKPVGFLNPALYALGQERRLRAGFPRHHRRQQFLQRQPEPVQRRRGLRPLHRLGAVPRA
jgi:subtilase family serine protease